MALDAPPCQADALALSGVVEVQQPVHPHDGCQASDQCGGAKRRDVLVEIFGEGLGRGGQGTPPLLVASGDEERKFPGLVMDRGVGIGSPEVLQSAFGMG